MNFRVVLLDESRSTVECEQAIRDALRTIAAIGPPSVRHTAASINNGSRTVTIDFTVHVTPDTPHPTEVIEDILAHVGTVGLLEELPETDIP